jgi:hypothetical protein
MKLERREKILAAVAGGLVLAIALWLLLFSGSNLSYSQLENRRDQLDMQVKKKEFEVKAAEAAVRRLAGWQRRALPSDAIDARLVYQTWLRQLVDQLQFQKSTVEPTSDQPGSKTFTLLKFKVLGRTNLPKLVEFLHAFYSAGHLHQISSLDVTRVANSGDLDVKIDIEGMSLRGADRKSELAKEPGKALRLAKLPDYSTAIVARNLFSPPQGAPPDMAQTTFVTGIVAAAGRGEVWLVDKTSGRDWKLHEGEPVQVGSFQGSVKTIGANDVTLDLGGRQCRYRCGDSLRGGEEVRTPQDQRKVNVPRSHGPPREPRKTATGVRTGSL